MRLSFFFLVLAGCGGGSHGSPDTGTLALDAGDAEDGATIPGDAPGAPDDAPAFADVPSTPIDAGGFPGCSFVDSLDRSCTVDADCEIGVHQTDCCGNTYAIGLAPSERDRFDAWEPMCRATYPACGCPSGPTQTDSGESAFDASSIQVACVIVGPTQRCRTYVTIRPPDGR
jgi:hypothetical protein